jgi:hypothetical protein
MQVSGSTSLLILLLACRSLLIWRYNVRIAAHPQSLHKSQYRGRQKEPLALHDVHNKTQRQNTNSYTRLVHKYQLHAKSEETLQGLAQPASVIDRVVAIQIPFCLSWQ